MSIKEDAAIKLKEAYDAALVTPNPVCRHGEFIDYVIDNTHLTFKYILFTAILAKATDASINPLCLQRDRNCQVRMMQELCAIRSLFRLRWKHWKKLWAVQMSRF